MMRDLPDFLYGTAAGIAGSAMMAFLINGQRTAAIVSFILAAVPTIAAAVMGTRKEMER